MTLSVCVQHHPSRAHLLGPLLERLDGAEVVSDPRPQGPRSALRTYREALRLTPADATHRLVVQDDAWPCENLQERAWEAISRVPDRLVAFFVPGTGGHRRAMLRAHRAGDPVVELPSVGSWVPTVALSWPRALALEFWEFSARYPETWEGDDNAVGEFCRLRAIGALAVVPSLVEHPNVEPSLLGRRSGAASQARTAALLAD